ncbi:MAG: hypothetical protein JO100_07615 [Pseudonocardia sp.]|nr:hypothetical protein [Pseudonocardia sp.]
MTTHQTPARHYRDVLLSAETEEVMRRGNIIPADGTPTQLLEFVSWRLAERDAAWAPPHRAVAFADEFVADMLAGRLTSAARADQHVAGRPTVRVVTVRRPRRHLP